MSFLYTPRDQTKYPIILGLVLKYTEDIVIFLGKLEKIYLFVKFQDISEVQVQQNV